MKTFNHLYGDNDPRQLHQMNYLTALHTKILWSKQLIDDLQEIPMMERPMSRINDCLQSQSFNRALINEYKD